MSTNANAKELLKYKKSVFSGITVIVRWFFLISVSYVVLYPIIFMLCKSFISPAEAFDSSVVWVPRHWSVENYSLAIEALEYWKTFGRTMGVQIVSALIETFTCSLAAYGLARFKFKGSSLIFACVILSILVPSQAIIVPLYINFTDLEFFGIVGLLEKIIGTEMKVNIINTGWSFYLPALFGVGLKSGLFIFIYRQFFVSFPRELEEAASIDGAGPYYTFFRIVVPSTGIAYLCVMIFSVIAYWNDYYLSVMFFKENYPLSVALSRLGESLSTGNALATREGTFNIKMTACLLFIIPILVLYLVLQRKFVQSIERIGIVG